jgi:LCP family protein required for cell wall assembly
MGAYSYLPRRMNSSRTPLRANRDRRAAPPQWQVLAIGGVFALASLLAAWLVFASVRDFVAGWKITAGGPNGPAVAGQGGGSAATPGAGSSTSLVPQKWSGTDRVTVLLLGIDRRQGETEHGYLTDSMMILTVDPVGRTAAMLSIPRDLWVEVPGYGVDTINTANRTGDYYNYPGGGPALAVKTMAHNLGITVDYYVRLDFTAFETLIDAIGGIDVEVKETIDDPLYPDGSYGYEPFHLDAGWQHLNGHDALRYARTRHNSSDIDRAARQQQVVLAVRDKVLSLNMLPTLFAKAPGLFNTLNQSISTNLSLEQIVSLALLAQDIPRENIQNAVIDYHYVLDYTTPEGRQVLVPLRDKIRELRDSLFTTAAARPPANLDDPVLMAGEGARVTVLNGAGVPGLAQATAAWLKSQGVNVVVFDTADRSDYPNSVIVDVTGTKPYTTRWLARVFRVGSVLSGTDPNSPVDVKVILGADWTVPTATP